MSAVLDPYSQLKADIPWLHQSTMRQALRYYDDVIHHQGCTDTVLAILGRSDRFFLLTHLLHRSDAVHPWLYARCREVEAETDDYLDLWARDHYKSTLITFAGAIQEILNDPEITIGIFSHNRPIAKKFLAQIARELEYNDLLKRVFNDVLWTLPRREAPVWSSEDGIVVKRQGNPKEKTVEAWGLVDGQPTSAHFRLGIFDDVVTRESVTTPEQIIKTTEAWELAQNLLSSQHPRRWMIGTRYKYADTYDQLVTRGAVKTRIYAATDDGTIDGNPVFLRQDVWEKKKSESSIATLACQQLQNPSAGSEQEFKPEWLRKYEVRPLTLNVYIMCDYAGGRHSSGSSKTAMAVVGVDTALNKYLLDGACHKMSLTERWSMLKKLRNRWVQAPGVQIVEVGYERYGAQTDIEHFETMMELESREGNQGAFDIKELNWPRDGSHEKDNRIRRLEPDLRNWRFYFPYVGDMTKRQIEAVTRGQPYLVSQPIKQKNEDGKLYDIVELMIRNEYLFFPNTPLKDFLDATSRLYDMDVVPPIIYNERDLLPIVPED